MLTTTAQIWTQLGCQGVLVGIGTGILIHVLAPILPEYFPQHSGLAQGTMYACKCIATLTRKVAEYKQLQLLEELCGPLR